MTDLLKIISDIWGSVARCLTEHGFWDKKPKIDEVIKPKALGSNPSSKIRVLINTVKGKAEDDEGNTMIPVIINKVESIAILDSGS